MQNKKPYYIYDKESVNYVEEKVTTAGIVKRIILYVVGGFVIAVGVSAFLFYGFDTEETASLKKRQDQLEAYKMRAEAENEELRELVVELENQDQELKERILGVKEDEIGLEKIDSANTTIAANPITAEEKLKELELALLAQEKRYDEVFENLKRNNKHLTHIPNRKPVKGQILAFFGERMHPALKRLKQHNGIDFEAREGTEVYATGDGTIKFAGTKKRSLQGNLIRIDHGKGLETRYAHLSGFAVKQGQKVKRGDLIGYSGRPSNGKGPHLHYEVLVDGKHVDPLNYLFSEFTRTELLEVKKDAQLAGESMD
ncbi:MAG: peptidoglycan DD-metalloendopeptidase family protein [Bacteroidia bacterium]